MATYNVRANERKINKIILDIYCITAKIIGRSLTEDGVLIEGATWPVVTRSALKRRKQKRKEKDYERTCKFMG